MALYPDATFIPIERYAPGGAKHRPTNGHNRLVFHTAVTDKQSMFDFFNVDGRATPHFFVAEHGEVEQYIDTEFGSSADLDGDHDIISVESWDDNRVRDWTADQVEACAKLAAWVNKVHDIPLVRLPSSVKGLRGVGWHRLGIPPAVGHSFPDPAGELLGGVVEGGEIWTLSPSKLCPGDPKIKGIVNDIIPRAIEIANGDDMSQEDIKAINAHTDAAIKRVLEVVNKQAARERKLIKTRLTNLRTAIDENASRTEIKKLLDDLADELHHERRTDRTVVDPGGAVVPPA